MCTYTFTLDDKLVEKVRPAFADDKAIKNWLQSQIEVLFMQKAANFSPKTKSSLKLSERLRGIGHAPEGFDYKKELADRF
ncbi:MAG: hypothetical protein IKW86_09860 [Salinivirgaceae bacterium]|nr:hypothetical protein [Salinivirgaceae bacterium]